MFLLTLAALLACSAGVLGGPIVHDDWVNVGSLAQRTVSSPSTAKELFHAALIRQTARAHAGDYVSVDCSVVENFVASIVAPSQPKLSEVAYAVRAARMLECRENSKAQEFLSGSLSSGRLTELFHAVGGLNKNSDAAAVGKLMDTVLGLQDGVMFKTSKKTQPSVLAAGLAFHILADAANYLDSALSSSHKSKLQALLKGAPGLLTTAKHTEDGFLALGDRDPLLVTYLTLTGVHSLARVLGETSTMSVSSDTLSGLAEMLLQYAAGGDVVAVGQSLASLETLAKGAPQVFRAVMVVDSHVPVVEARATGRDSEITVSVTDVFGFRPKALAVTMKAVTSTQGTAVAALRGVPLTEKFGAFSAAFGEHVDAAGVYNVVLDLDSGDAAWANGATSIQVKATGSISVGPAYVHTSRARQSDAKAKGTRVEYPDKTGKDFSIQQRQYFHLAFEVKDGTGSPMSVHQAFVAFTDRVTRKTVTVVATPAETGLYAAVVNPSSFPSTVASGSKRFDVTVLVGDALVKNAVAWEIGSMVVEFPEAGETNEVLYTKPLLHESDITLKPLKEITHQFREPDARPPSIVSVVFSALAVAPLGILLIGWLRLKALSSFRSIPASAYLHGFLFIGGLGACFAVLLAYWFMLNMFQALALLAVPLLVLFFSGTFLFRALSAHELPPDQPQILFVLALGGSSVPMASS